jgi:hypothetical protein
VGIMRRMSNDPTAPIPYASVAVATEPRRPTIVTVLAIIAIVAYSALLLCSPLSLLPAASDDPVDTAFAGEGVMRVYNIVYALISIVLAAMAIIGASFCLVMRPWARRWLVRVAIADLVITAIGAVVFFAVTLPDAMQIATDPSSRSMVIAVMVVTAVVVLAWPVLPGCIVYFFTRPRIIEAFEAHRAARATSVYDVRNV